MEDVVPGIDQEDGLEEGAVVGGSAESDEHEAKTQGNPHPHLTRRQERTKGLRETSLQCGTRYERWSGDTPRVWKIGRLVQKKIELSVMAMEELTSQRKKWADGQPKKSIAARARKAT